MTNKKLVRLFTISYLSLCATAGSALAMEATDLEEAADSSNRIQRSPKPFAEPADFTDDHATEMIHHSSLQHPDPSSLEKDFTPTRMPEDQFHRVFGPSIAEFKALAARLYKQPTETDATPSTAVQAGMIDETVARQMRDVRVRLEDSLRPTFGFALDKGRMFATGTWYVSDKAIAQQASELRRTAASLSDVSALMRSLNKAKEADEQHTLRELMVRTASSLDTLYAGIPGNPEFESFSWGYLRPTAAHPRNLALFVTPLTLPLYEQALEVLELMTRKSGELASYDSFDLTPYRPLSFSQGPTYEEMRHVIYPPHSDVDR